MNGRGASFIGISLIIVLLFTGTNGEVGDNDEKAIDTTDPGFLPVESIKADDDYLDLISVASDMNKIATTGSDQRIKIWSYPELDLLFSIEYEKEIAVLEWSPNSRWIAFVNYSLDENHAWVNVYDTGRMMVYERFEMPFRTKEPWYVSLAWSPNGMQLLFSMNDNTLHIIDSEVTSSTINNIWKYEREDANVTDAEWFPDNDRFAVSYDDGNIDVVEYPNMVMLQTYDVNGTIGDIEITGDDLKILSYQMYDTDLTVRVLNITKGTYYVIDQNFNSIQYFPLEMSRDGSRFMVGRDVANGSYGVSIWDTMTGDLIDFISKDTWELFSIQWVGDGVILTADDEGDLIIWNEDIDRDGIRNNEDAFPGDPYEAFDSDGDGVGDNSDAFPSNPWASIDSDWDGYPDELHDLPNSEGPDLEVDGYPNDPDRWREEPDCCGSTLIPMIIVVLLVVAVIISVLFVLVRRRRQ